MKSDLPDCPGVTAAGADMSLARKIVFLSNTGAYPGPPPYVEVVETHMSWVFLTDRDVFKLKKPVRRPFLDFTTLDNRRRNCEEEYRLNQRLARGVYLGVEALVRNRMGQLQLGGAGSTEDWLVHMRRLPADRMLDVLIRRRQLQKQALLPAAGLLAEFYARATPVGYAAQAYVDRFRRLMEENHEVLTHPDLQLPPAQCDRLLAAQRRFLNSHGEALRQRAARVIEAHGDLRPEHICLVTPPVVIDCLEFNREFRLQDPAAELAFLKLECDMAGAGYIADVFLDRYRRRVHDDCPAHVLAFYQAVHAQVKAKLAVWHLPEDPRQKRRHWLRHAARYLDRAEHYLHRRALPPA